MPNFSTQVAPEQERRGFGSLLGTGVKLVAGIHYSPAASVFHKPIAPGTSHYLGRTRAKIGKYSGLSTVRGAFGWQGIPFLGGIYGKKWTGKGSTRGQRAMRTFVTGKRSYIRTKNVAGKLTKRLEFKGLHIAGGILQGAVAAFQVVQIGRAALAAGKHVTAITQMAPKYLEEKLRPLREAFNTKVDFGGDVSAIGVGSNERQRAVQMLDFAGGLIRDRRISGNEAKYYSQF